MLAVDNFVQSPYSSQGYNRYSYVHNSPLGAVDPTGEIVDYLNDAIAANSWDPYGWGQGQKFDGTVVFGVSSDGAGVNIYAGGSLSSNSSTWVFGGNTQTGRFGGGVSSFGLPSYTQVPSAASFSIDWGGVNEAAWGEASSRFWSREAGNLNFHSTDLGSLASSDNAQTAFLLGIGLSADWARSAASIFQGQNFGIRQAAISNGIPIDKIDRIIGKTTTFSNEMKLLGRRIVIYGAMKSSYDVLSSYQSGDTMGAKKAGIDLSVGLGTAAMGGVAGVFFYGTYMMISTPPYLPANSGYLPDNSIFPMDNTYVNLRPHLNY